MPTDLPISTRLWFALYCAFRVLFDGGFARRTWSAKTATEQRPILPSGPDERVDERAETAAAALHETDDEAFRETDDEAAAVGAESAGGHAKLRDEQPDPSAGAISLLRLLQQHGRFVDFLQQDIADFDDSEVGAAARVVHSGCRKVLRSRAEIVPVRDEDEESRVTVSTGVKEGIVKLTGNLKGEPPFHGTLRHRGWRIRHLKLPTQIAGQDSEILAAAEVEL